MRRHSLFLVIGGIAALCGCRPGWALKRQSEMNCPTDIRQTVPWCAGEDAVFHCPCSPASDYYGHKPTCWGAWPTSGAAWRDAYCGACPPGGQYELLNPTPMFSPGQPASEPIDAQEVPRLEPLPAVQSSNATPNKAIQSSAVDTSPPERGGVAQATHVTNGKFNPFRRKSSAAR